MNKDRVWTFSNAITLIRPLLALPIVLDIVRTGGEPSLWTVLLFVIGGISDGVDGYLARRLNEVTQLGTMLDPVADKIFGTAIFAALVYVGLLPAWLFWALVIKEGLLLLGGAILLRGKQSTISARPLGKVATVILFIGFGLILAGIQSVGHSLAVIGVILSLAAGIDYALVVRKRWNISSLDGDD